jgi:hypothetical protein
VVGPGDDDGALFQEVVVVVVVVIEIKKVEISARNNHQNIYTLRLLPKFTIDRFIKMVIYLALPADVVSLHLYQMHDQALLLLQVVPKL